MANINRVTRNGKTFNVKNLGYLLRNWKDVTFLSTSKYCEQGSTFNRGLLVAYFKDGGRGEWSFMDYTVMMQWIDRPVFRGIPVQTV
jgi:hypothetical protein